MENCIHTIIISIYVPISSIRFIKSNEIFVIWSIFSNFRFTYSSAEDCWISSVFVAAKPGDIEEKCE